VYEDLFENLTLLSILLEAKIVCSPSFSDNRSRANTTRELDFDHMIK
jgi:hypothetical protein